MTDCRTSTPIQSNATYTSSGCRESINSRPAEQLLAATPFIGMSQQPSEPHSQLDSRRTTVRSAAVSLPLASLPQLPVDVLSLVYLHLLWYERVLHVSHVHRQLPSVWLVWNENDHVRLNDALLGALEQLRPSAVHCCRYVQSLRVEREMDDELLDDIDVDKPPPLRRLHSFLQRQLDSHSQSATPPFSSLRSLIASQEVLGCLLDCSGLPHLHSLSLYSSGELDMERDDKSPLLGSYSSSLPALRRLRVETLNVAYSELFSLPSLEHADVRYAHMTGHDEPLSAPASSTLRCLLLGDHRLSVDQIVAPLLTTSLLHLSINARLTNDHLHTLTSLQSLTSLELVGCYFDDTNALGRLMSEDGRPLLLNLQRFAIDDCDADEIDYDDMRTSTAAFLHAYSRQLRHIKLAVKADPANSLGAVLSVIVSSMAQLESLELAVQYSNFGASEVLHNILMPSDAPPQPDPPPSLPALRSLTLSNLPMSDAAVDQLLACCPHLLELIVDCVAPLTATVWSSLLYCRQLLSFDFRPVSEVATEAAFTAATSSSLLHSSSSLRQTAALPCLTHLGLDLTGCGRVSTFDHISLVDRAGFAMALGHFSQSPITSLRLHLPRTANYHQRCLFVRQLASLPHLTSLQLDIDESDSEGHSPPVGESLMRLLHDCSEPMRCSNWQHHVNMTYFWRDGLLGEEEEELRVKYAAGVKLRSFPSELAGGTYRLFKPAVSEGEEDGKVKFFQRLDAVRDAIVD